MKLDDLLIWLLIGGFVFMLTVVVIVSTQQRSTIEARRAICDGSDGVLVEGTHCLLLPTNNLIDLRGRQDD
jgi:hypothetical protein